VVLLVIDSLRARSLGQAGAGGPRTPFLDRLAGETLCFTQARATECWTLPTHLSMFTGLMPSQHGAHFQSMAYRAPSPTAAELFAAAGHHTEVLTRNSLFDGTVPGATRGFAHLTRVLAELKGLPDPLSLLLAISKPRVRRLIESSGFFHTLQRDDGRFLMTLARMIVPADAPLLERTLDVMVTQRRAGRPYFLFVNCYDVHAPYAPRPDSPLASFGTLGGWIENLMLPRLSVQLGNHAYLQPDFHMSPRGHDVLLRRYHRAIELMDGKLETFYESARGAGLLDDTILIVVSDHGEAFGEHDLYFHDASTYDTHLRVPLWIHHPDRPPAVVDDCVSTRDLFGVLASVARGGDLRGTMLDAEARAAAPVALAEHFHYPHAPGLQPRYARDIAAAVVGRRKLRLGADGPLLYDLTADPDERRPVPASLGDFAAACRDDGAPARALDAALAHLGRWDARSLAA
jgi:arylsulfatase A-like enzyme